MVDGVNNGELMANNTFGAALAGPKDLSRQETSAVADN